MKTFILLLTLGSFPAATAQQVTTTSSTFDQQRAASSQAVMVKYPEAADPHSRLSDIALEIVRDWKNRQDWRLATPDFPMYLWDAAAAQLRAEKEAAATPASKTYFFQTVNPTSVEKLKLPPLMTEEEKREHADLGKALARYEQEKQSAALRESQAAIKGQYEARKAEIQRQLEERLAQIRATSFVTPTPPAPISPATSLPTSRSGGGVTTISGSGGVYTTHGGSTGGATIINTAPGHYEVRKNGQTQRVIITTP